MAYQNQNTNTPPISIHVLSDLQGHDGFTRCVDLNKDFRTLSRKQFSPIFDKAHYREATGV